MSEMINHDMIQVLDDDVRNPECRVKGTSTTAMNETAMVVVAQRVYLHLL